VRFRSSISNPFFLFLEKAQEQEHDVRFVELEQYLCLVEEMPSALGFREVLDWTRRQGHNGQVCVTVDGGR
jgi:hypothetical protein